MISNPITWPNGARVAFCHADDPQAADTEAEINAITEGFGYACDVSDECQMKVP